MSRFAKAGAVKMHMDVSQELFCVEICKKSAVCQSRDTRFVRACAVEMRTDISQAPFCLDLFCASLRSRNAHGRFTRAILCGNLQEKCLTPSPRHIRFVRACAVEMHMDMSQEAFCGEIYRKNADTTSIEHRPLTITIRTPQCGHTVWEICLKKTLMMPCFDIEGSENWCPVNLNID